MIPRRPSIHCLQTRFPRMSGDEPDYIDTLRIARKFSPCERG